MIDILCTLGIRHVMGLLNCNVVGFGNTDHTGAYTVCKGARFILLFASMHFVIVHIINFKHRSTCPLLA